VKVKFNIDFAHLKYVNYLQSKTSFYAKLNYNILKERPCFIDE